MLTAGLKTRAIKVAEELKAGNRIWFKNGSFHENQGFTVFPIRNDELELMSKEGISRILTEDEVAEEIKSPFCTNSDTIKLLVQILDNADWVRKIINSCQNSFQLNVAKVILEMYCNKYGNNKLHDDLLSAFLAKEAMIIVP